MSGPVGASEPGRRILVVGLDCATPELVFDAWRDDLPTIRGLMERGAWGRLESTVPAITVPAWSSMMTGLDPGQLGFYGFRNRRDHTYDGMRIADSRAVQDPRVWDILSAAGKRVGVIGVPQTYPVRPVNGELVSCFLTPGADSEYTFPQDLKQSIESWIEGPFLVDVPNFRSDDKSRILADIYAMAEQRFAICRELLRTRTYDFFMFVDMGVDRIHHAFWRYMDPSHPKHEPGSPFGPAIHDYYVFVDRNIGELLTLVDDDTIVVVVSDHGARPIVGGICVNEWLIEQGYLALADYPSDLRSLHDCDIDWSRTKAWGEGGYYGRVMMNVKGREPAGIIEPEDYEAERAELAAKLEHITDPEGREIGTRAYRPEDVYVSVKNVSPDLIVYFGDLAWRSVGTVGFRSVWTFENDTGPDDANHAQHGIFVYFDPLDPGGGRRLADVSIYDVAPTLLGVFDQSPPERGRGGAIELDRGYSADEEAEVTSRLQDLGYL